MSAPPPDDGPVTFSIIVPVYNRRDLVGRALASCLRQDHADFEVVVVDDASDDGTAAAVAALGDPRIRLLRHAVNRGVCAARNTGVAAATGRWCVMLDSDFELLDGALGRLAARCRTAPPDVGNVASMCAWDRGPDTPVPAPSGDVVYDYEGYVRYWCGLVVPESFNCIRREVFDRLRYPEGRAYEGGFHLDMARLYRFSLTRERFVLIHTDAANRITASPPAATARRLLRDAHDSAAEAERLLRAHGDLIGRVSPAKRRGYLHDAVEHHLLDGSPSSALALLLDEGGDAWRSPRLWASLGLGLAGPRTLAAGRAWWAAAARARRAWRPIAAGR